MSAAPALGDEKSSDISERIYRQQDDLAKSRDQLAQLNKEISDKEQSLQRNRMELADTSAMLREAEDRYDDSLRRYNERISAIYKMGKSEFYAVMLSSEGFSDSINRMSYLVTISEQDLHLLQQVKLDEMQVRSLRIRVDGLKQSSAVNLDDLKDQKQGLEQEIMTGQKQVAADSDRLIEVRAREQEEEVRRLLAEEQQAFGQDFTIYGGMMGPSILIGSGPPAGMNPTGTILSGVASWYGPGFNGNHTANGETYNMFAPTAAHKTLPFGTWLKVTFNGRSVFVRINDRGPYIPGRFLDLSAGSAQAIGLTGIGQITAEIYR